MAGSSKNTGSSGRGARKSTSRKPTTSGAPKQRTSGARKAPPRKSGASPRQARRVPWSRRIGVAAAFVLLVGAGIAFAGNALTDTGKTGARTPPIPPPAAPALAAPEPALTRRATTDVAGTLPNGLTNGANALRIYVNGELEREREAPNQLDFTVAKVPLAEGDNEIRAALSGPGGESPMSEPIIVTRDTTPPQITVTRPEPNSVVWDAIQTMRGSTEPGASLTIREPGSANAIDAIVGGDGRFAAEIHLGMGPNRLILHSEDAAGNDSTIDYQIRRSDSQGSVILQLSTAELAAADLPQTVDVVATGRDEHGRPSYGAEVTFGLSPPNRGTTTYRATTENGRAEWNNLIVNGDEHAIGEWLITVLVTLDSGEELRTIASLNVR